MIHPEDTVVRLLALEGLETDAYRYSAQLGENEGGAARRPGEGAARGQYGVLRLSAVGRAGDHLLQRGCLRAAGRRIREMLLTGELARLYQDTSTHDSPNPSHCFYGKLEAAIPPEHREQGILYALGQPL